MQVKRVFTKDLTGDIFESLEWKSFDVCLKDHRSDKILYKLNDIEAPPHWSQQSVDIMASKYFRRAEVPFKTKQSKKFPYEINIEYSEVVDLWPDFVFPSVSDDPEGTDVSNHGESSVKQVFHRLAGAWTYWGLLSGLLCDGENTSENAKIFYDEIVYMLYHQMAAPNSPQFFNTGVWWAYGIEGRPCGHSFADFEGNIHNSKDLYSRSQAHACFILGLEDNLLEENGIYDLLRKEARIFKLGSGAGTNFSNLRAEGERLSGGGTSSGLISFLRIFDRAADCIKSGGITRRAAKMLVTDVDHPDILDYINWKSDEEKKAQALINAGYESDFNGEAYKTISGQNGNNSVSVSHEFMQSFESDAEWNTWWRIDKAKYTDEKGITDWESLKNNCKPARTFKAQKIWNKMIDSSWKCADPAIHFNGTMNDWNTLAEDGSINSTNPCLSGDTLVYVIENDEIKKIKIKDIKENDITVISYDFVENRIVLADAKNLKITRENSEVIKIKTIKGEIKLTPDHEILTNKGWVKAKDVQNGDKAYKFKNNGKDKQLTFSSNSLENYPKRENQFFQLNPVDSEEIEILSVEKLNETEDVYDFNVSKHHCFFTDEMLVSNCSEYISLDDTACNLASINLVKFLDDINNEFKVSEYKHAIRIWQMILEITNHMAQLPSENVAYNVWKYRRTGLGPANLGTLLMMMGYSYEAEESRTISAALMSIMTGHSYCVSAEMAEELGAFPAYDKNRNHMLKVIKNHRAAAYGMSDDMDPQEKRELCKTVPDYDGLIVKPVPLQINEGYDKRTAEFVHWAKQSWDDALSFGSSFGYRNAQVTVCAPTGTVSLIMGCDSTGIEPCYALVTYKTLAGGGMMKIVNNSVKKTLKNLGSYDQEQIDSICKFIQENGYVRGSGIKAEHEDIFKCAASPLGEEGIIIWQSHIQMLAALQSFVSGGISKTINMPESATHVDISEAWKMAYRLGCKGVSIYRDNCKMSAPLAINNGKDQSISEDVIQRVTETALVNEIVRRKTSNALDIQHLLDSLGITQSEVDVAKREWGQRKRPGDLLNGMRFRIKIGQAQGYVQIFVYPDGRICEFFLTFGNPGSSLNNMLECWSIAFSIALQRGESLRNLCSKYINVEFEPKGFTGRKDEIRRVTSPVDYIVRLMLMYFDDEGYIKDPSIFCNMGSSESHEETEEGTTMSGFEFSESKDNISDNISGNIQRPPCPKCGAIMTSGSDKCPVCASCGYFGGCG